MKIFYHAADLDGRCSAAIAMRKWPNATVLAYNYYYDFPHDKIQPGEEVVFVDVFFDDKNEADLTKLLAITDKITILDHHRRKMADRVFAEKGIKYKGIIDPDAPGACALVWQYCFPKVDMPIGVRYIGEYDTWDRHFNNARFQLAVNAKNTGVFNKWLWDKILRDDSRFMLQMINEGNTIIEYLRPWYARYIRAYGRIGSIEDGKYSILLVPMGMVDSSIFDSIPALLFDVYARSTIGRDGDWKISITTNRLDLDLRDVAEKFDGGGHKKACGMSVKAPEDMVTFNPNADRTPLQKYYRNAYDFIDGVNR